MMFGRFEKRIFAAAKKRHPSSVEVSGENAELESALRFECGISPDWPTGHGVKRGSHLWYACSQSMSTLQCCLSWNAGCLR